MGFSYDSSATPHAVRWAPSGITLMFPGGFGFDFTSNSLCVSSDGLNIGGWHAPTIVEEKAFTWSEAAGEQLLATRSGVQAFSANGAIAAGYVVHGRGEPQRASIWDINRSQRFIDSPGVIPTSDARGVSADGTIVVGQAVFNNMIRAFRWTEATGMQNIGSPDAGGPESHADAITPDGSVVVGAWGSQSQLLAARWTSEGGWQVLGGLPGGLVGSAYAVSADGNTIVGTGNGHAFIWRSDRGLEDLQTVLAPPAGWTLTEARGITADGRTIVGTGSLVGVGSQAWMATLPCFDVTGDTHAIGCIGGTVTLGVAVAGSGPFEFQWRYNSSPIDPATNPSAATARLVLGGVSEASAGSYDCVVTNSCGSITHSPVTLTVNAAGSGDGNGDFLIDGRDIAGLVGTLVNGYTPAAGNCAYDLNGNGSVDMEDLGLFVDRLLAP